MGGYYNGDGNGYGNGYGNGGYGGNGALVIPVSYGNGGYGNGGYGNGGYGNGGYGYGNGGYYGNGYYSGGYGRSLVNNRDASESDEKDGDIPEDVLAAQKMVDEAYDDYTAKATATGLTPVPKDQLMEAMVDMEAMEEDMEAMEEDMEAMEEDMEATMEVMEAMEVMDMEDIVEVMEVMEVMDMDDKKLNPLEQKKNLPYVT